MVIIANIGFRLPEQEKAMLAVRADRNETTISDIVRNLIRDYLGSVSPSGETTPPVPAPTQVLGWQQEENTQESIEL